MDLNACKIGFRVLFGRDNSGSGEAGQRLAPVRHFAFAADDDYVTGQGQAIVVALRQKANGSSVGYVR